MISEHERNRVPSNRGGTRKGAGRPRVRKDEARLSVRLEPHQLEAIKAAAEHVGAASLNDWATAVLVAAASKEAL